MGHGGRRAGAGRKRAAVPARAYRARLSAGQAKLLRMWGRGDISAGLRWLIDTADHFLVKKDHVWATGKYRGPRLTTQYVGCLTERHAALLRQWGGGNLSAGLRWLIDVAAPMIRKRG